MTEGALRFSGGLLFYRVCENLCGLNLSKPSELPCPAEGKCVCTTHSTHNIV